MLIGYTRVSKSVKGIYLITDIASRKCYVGSSYGDQGIWSRWCSYIASGHGGNAELRALASDTSQDIAGHPSGLLCLHTGRAEQQATSSWGRESFWKRILLTRGEQGLNRN